MDKRFILTIVLTFLVLFIWQLFFFKPPEQKAKKEAERETVFVEPDTSRLPPSSVVQEEEQKKPSPQEIILEGSPFTVVESPLYQVEISLLGGALTRFTLKDYKYAKDGLVQLIPQGRGIFLADYGEIADPQILYSTSRDTILLGEGEEDTLLLFAETPKGRIEKRYIFQGSSYLFRVEIEGPQRFSLVLSQGLLPTEKNLKSDLQKFAALFYTASLKKYSLKSLKGGPVFQGGENLTWAGVRTKYFFLALIPSKQEVKRIQASRDDSRVTLTAEIASPEASFSVYFGPIDYFILKDLGYGLSSVYSFGFALFAPFARGILYLFHFFQGFIANFGAIIILLAFLMKLVFWPFSIKSLRSMRRMQELKPKMDALRKLYKDDPQRLQKEMMGLYKQYKVNPFSGCLVLIFQLPIFWALYQILQNTIELRGAPFVLWIRDLSVKDPYYILPILMGAASFLQAMMQPAQDQQSRLFSMFMPVFLTVIFLNFPSGIVLYWLTYSALSVIEQMWLRKT